MSRRGTSAFHFSCQAEGHRFDSDVIEFKKGGILAFCRNCDERLWIEWIPGGTAAGRAKYVAESILSHEDPQPWDFEQIDEQLSHLQHDAELIDDARESLELARKVLAARLER